MRNRGRQVKIWAIVLFGLIAVPTQAQRLWTEVHLNRSVVYVGQPMEVSVRVFTSTWFTEGVDPGNIKVNGAFSVYFRSVSISETVEGKMYPGVEMIFNVFPFDEDDIIFPSLSIKVTSPPDGDYIGKEHLLKTAEKRIKVRPIPPGFDVDQWLVSPGLWVNDYWTGNLQNVKVGDVLERKVVRSASGTVSELIPPIVWDSLAGVSLYPARSEVKNNKTKTDISAIRTESMRYLFEKEGEVTLPEMVFTWWNPYRNKLYKRTLKAVTIDVQPNPNLGMLASVKDSLYVQTKAIEAAEAEDQPILILGMTPEKFIELSILIVLSIGLFVWGLFRFWQWFTKRRTAYKNTEAYFFNLFVKIARGKNRVQMLNAVYRWIVVTSPTQPTLSAFVEQYGTESMKADLISLENEESKNCQLHISAWKMARKKMIHSNHQPDETGKLAWINPT